MMGSILLYTGQAGGKTTTAFGLALRSVGHGHKVIVIQFMKGLRDTGEFKASSRLQPELEVYQFGRSEFVNLDRPDRVDIELARKGLMFAKEILRKKPHLLILDEINLAAAKGLLSTSEVLELLKQVPTETNIVLTGRFAPKELIEAADYVIEMIDRKRPVKELPARPGIEY